MAAIARGSSVNFLDEIEQRVPNDLDVHLVWDNYATHKTPLIRKLAGKTTSLARPPDADKRLLDQPGRAVLHPHHRTKDSSRHLPQRYRTPRRHRVLHRQAQHRSQA